MGTRITVTERCPYCNEILYQGSPKSKLGKPGTFQCPKCSGTISNGLKEWQDFKASEKAGEIISCIFLSFMVIIFIPLLFILIIEGFYYFLLKIEVSDSIVIGFLLFAGLPLGFILALAYINDFIDKVKDSNKRYKARYSSVNIDNSSNNKKHPYFHYLLILTGIYLVIFCINPKVYSITAKDIFSSVWFSLSSGIMGSSTVSNTVTQVQEKEYRLVDNVTNDLTPILEQVAQELEYNDPDGIKNWIYSDTVSDAQLGREIRKMHNTPTKNDQNGDNIIDCQDYAILFYKLASEATFDVKIISNSQLSHAFNAVKMRNGTYAYIEPQAGEGGKILMENAWKNYDPAYNEDSTERYLRYIIRGKND